MRVRVYFYDGEVGLSSVGSANYLSPPGGGLFRSGLDPPDVGVGAIACIYFYGEVGLSSVGSAIYCAGVHALLRPGEVGLPATSGVGPYVTLSVETGRDRYTQVQSMEENEIGLP